ncbi:hypothetical protein [Kitasatospora sp. NPDC004289]
MTGPSDFDGPGATDIYTAWAQLPAPQLKELLKAAELQRKREHEARMEQLRIVEQAQLAQQAADAEHARRVHRLLLAGLLSGFVIAALSMGSTVYLAQLGQEMAAGAVGLGGGVTVVVMLNIFVLRKPASTGDLKLISRSRAVLPNPSGPPPEATAPISPAP